MKKLLVIIASDPWSDKIENNQFDTFRSEGRYSINIGFGLSMLGYEVNIICNKWTLDEPKKVWNNVYLSKNPIYENYDTAFIFASSTELLKVNFNKAIVMGYEFGHIDSAIEVFKEINKPFTIVCPFKELINLHKEKYAKQLSSEIKYLPPLYPISCVNVGFLPYEYKPKLPELKIYMFYSSWKSHTFNYEASIDKDMEIIQLLKSVGYKLKLYVHIDNEATAKKCPLYGDETIYFYNDKNNYQDVINLLKNVDICITKGGLYDAGRCLPDIMSLGKPIIYIADGFRETGFNTINWMYNCPDNIIYMQESHNESLKKLKSIITNFEITYNCYKNTMSDFDFNQWKDIAKKVFEN